MQDQSTRAPKRSDLPVRAGAVGAAAVSRKIRKRHQAAQRILNQRDGY